MGNSASIARENELHRENEALRHELRREKEESRREKEESRRREAELRREKEESRRQQRVPLPLTEELRSSREQMLMQTEEELQRVQAILEYVAKQELDGPWLDGLQARNDPRAAFWYEDHQDFVAECRAREQSNDGEAEQCDGEAEL